MKKICLLFVLTTSILTASVLVVIVKKDIKFKSNITKENVRLEYVNNIKRGCSPLTKQDITRYKYQAKGHFKKSRVLCKKDVFLAHKNRLIFNFGMIEIEKDGKLLKETDEYIKIRNSNGKIEKIYKDGRK